ncbi:MAG: ceramidase domain-containing protein [Emcibacter sp.]|nr:ceramidase domain-containing protein [Emcibacter sp.]
MFFIDPIAQDLDYHDFADQDLFWTIPNFFNVISNIGFVFVGLWGLWKYGAEAICGSYRGPYLMLCAGILLTAFGSGWYHLFPANQSLVWDRLPMTIAFMSLFSLIIRDYIDEKTGRRLLVPLLLFGIGSIFYWYMTEEAGRGDLRPYALVQFLPLLLFPFIMLLYGPKHGSRLSLGLALLFYVVAKGAEFFDEAIYEALSHSVSGHSLKHLLAAAGSFCALKAFVSLPKDSHYEPQVPRG